MSTLEHVNPISSESPAIEALFLRDYRSRTAEEIQRDNVANLLVERDMMLLQQLVTVNAL